MCSVQVRQHLGRHLGHWFAAEMVSDVMLVAALLLGDGPGRPSLPLRLPQPHLAQVIDGRLRSGMLTLTHLHNNSTGPPWHHGPRHETDG